jgi:thioredoxin-related protein
MDTVTYPHEKVADFIQEHFIPVKIDRHELLEEIYRVPWTPTVLILDHHGRERFREVGYLPPDDFLAHMNLALGRIAFDDKDFSGAAAFFQTVVDQFAASETVPEALYFLGLARSKMAGGAKDDRHTIWTLLMTEHPKSDWTKKVSVYFG